MGAPPSELGRFRPMTTPTEWIEDYRPGKYHPVHLNDAFKDARYRVVRKLGYGSFSTVWLAKDQQANKYVALKILVADPDAARYEISILEALSQSKTEGLGKSHLMVMLDSFEHKGPNGTHRCLVFDVMGPSVATALEELPESAVSLTSDEERYPVWMAKSILRQTLLGIEFMHRNGVAHGDIQQGNLLFSVKDLTPIDEQVMSEDNETSEPVQTVDGSIDPRAPRYLALDRPLTEYLDISPGFQIKISDFGGAFFISEAPNTLVTPVALRSPEFIFEQKVGQDQDIWGFGCLIFELLIGRHLFLVGSMGSDEEVDDDHLLQFHDVLGPLPGHILSQYPRAQIYFNDKGEKIKNYIGNLPEGFDVNQIQPMATLEEQFDQEKPDELTDEEARVIKGLLRQILDYDVAKRPDATELLQHPWFSAMEREG